MTNSIEFVILIPLGLIILKFLPYAFQKISSLRNFIPMVTISTTSFRGSFSISYFRVMVVVAGKEAEAELWERWHTKRARGFPQFKII